MKKLIRLLIRLPKEDAGFFYFTMEANENLCFYSTTNDSILEGHRDIELLGTLDLKDEIKQVIQKLQQEISLNIIEEEIIDDPSSEV